MKVRAWYGLYGSIDLDEVLWHRVEVGGISLPHPALVNLPLRRGLSRPRRRRLSFLHELGHLQTFPFVLAYTMFLAVTRGRPGRSFRERICWCARPGTAHQAISEMAAEVYVMAREGRGYASAYRNRPHLLLGFWIAMAAIASVSARTRQLPRRRPRVTSLRVGLR